MTTTTFAALVWSLVGGALLLALSAIPLAYRRASTGVWTAHAALAIVLAAVVAAAAHVMIYTHAIPWWRTGAAYLAFFGMPALATAWAARAAHRQWPVRARWRVAAAAFAALVVSAAFGGWVAKVALPELSIAIQ